jgi:hypothetical protein
MRKKLLTEMVEQFQAKHRVVPRRIVVTPPALTVLALRRSVAQWWAGIPVECREIASGELASSGTRLGVDVKGDHVVAFDLV